MIMILKLIIASCIVIWDADCQVLYHSYQVPNYGQEILEKLRDLIPQIDYVPYGGRDTPYSPMSYNNNEQSYDNNALGTEKRALTYQPNLQNQQPQQQQTTYQPNLQSQQPYQQNQQSQTQNHQQTLQTQQISPQQQQQQQYQQNSPQNFQQQQQQNYQQSFQQQQQLNHQYNLQPLKQQISPQNSQQNYQQNLQQQQQNHDQNFQFPQEQNYQTNPQQQIVYQQSYQPEQNVQSQPQNFQQSIKPQSVNLQQNYQQKQQKDQQNQQPHNYNVRPSNTATSPNGAIPSKFGSDHTGKTSQNANYNNETFAITRFGLKLLKGMNSPENVVLSPYSIAMLLALVQQGARGYTQQEITQALQLKPDTSAELFKKLTAFFKRRGSINTLKIANNVFLKNTFKPDRKFQSNAIENFGSEVRQLNFNNQYQSVQMINKWVADRTGQKITNLLAPDALQPDDLAVLVNAIYFKGTWDIKFRPELTMIQDFTLSDGSKKPVHFMQARRLFQTDIDLVIKSQILLLPFQGNQYSMMFILPLEGTDVNYVLSTLTEPQLYAYQNLSPKEVKLEIPRFTIQQDSEITRLLNDLNIWSMFSNNADLSGIGSDHGRTPRISSGVHSAVLSIDENGGSAAAATAYSVVALSYDDPSTSFAANRPFIAILWDNQLRMPLFMAKIEDPSV